MPRPFVDELEVIGIARKPNDSDLRKRGLTGLLDPGPEVARRRAQLESEQAELRAKMEYSGVGFPVSFVRTKVGEGRSNEDVRGWDCETVPSTGIDDRAVEMDVGHGKGEEKILNSTVHADTTEPSKPPVVDEACGFQKGVRKLRDRTPIQIQPYALEREVYRQVMKSASVWE